MDYKQFLFELQLEKRIDINEAVKVGSCVVRFDDAIDISFETAGAYSDQSVLHIHCMLGSILAEEKSTILENLMSAHLFGLHTNQAYFGFSSESQQILYFKTLQLSELSPEQVIESVEQFVDDSIKWRETLPHLNSSTIA